MFASSVFIIFLHKILHLMLVITEERNLSNFLELFKVLFYLAVATLSQGLYSVFLQYFFLYAILTAFVSANLFLLPAIFKYSLHFHFTVLQK